MNDATQRMAKYAFWSTLIVGFGTALLLWTLWETRKANQSAREAVDVTREVGQAQVRAYLYCKSARYRLRKDDLFAEIDIANAGQSPATNVLVQAELTYYLMGGPIGHSRPLLWRSSSVQASGMEPIVASGFETADIAFFGEIHFETDQGDSGDDDTPPLDPTEANEVALDLVVSWSDVFGIRHRFQVMMQAGIDVGPNHPRKKRSPNGTFGFTMSDTERVA